MLCIFKYFKDTAFPLRENLITSPKSQKNIFSMKCGISLAAHSQFIFWMREKKIEVNIVQMTTIETISIKLKALNFLLS